MRPFADEYELGRRANAGGGQQPWQAAPKRRPCRVVPASAENLCRNENAVRIAKHIRHLAALEIDLEVSGPVRGYVERQILPTIAIVLTPDG